MPVRMNVAIVAAMVLAGPAHRGDAAPDAETSAVSTARDQSVRIPRAVERAIRSAFVIKLPTEVDERRVRTSPGAGALLSDGRLVSALHVFVDSSKSVRGKRWKLLPDQAFIDARLTFAADDGADLAPLAEGSESTFWESDDLIVITPETSLQRSGVKLAKEPVEPGDRVTFVGLSERRGGTFEVRRSHVTIRATTSPHFFVFGESVRGDSGGPIFNDKGELVGLIISSGEHGTAIDVQTDMTRPEKKVLVSQTRAPGIIAVDVVKLLR
ncbi:MAG: serine protease [Planctomycetota bacterium]